MTLGAYRIAARVHGCDTPKMMGANSGVMATAGSQLGPQRCETTGFSARCQPGERYPAAAVRTGGPDPRAPTRGIESLASVR